MFRRLQSIVRSAPGPNINAGDFDDLHNYVTGLGQVFYGDHGDCFVTYAVVEIAHRKDGEVIGHITWDGEYEVMRFRPCVPDDTQPIPIP